ncbi:MAG: hypothetical protein ACKVP0_01890 [Pirellulaceae bacterium]
MSSKKISLVIPIGKFSFFVHACLQNIFETCRASESLDFVYLTSQDIAPELQNAFQDAAKDFSFRVVSAPFNSGSDHLQLLDWAVRNADLTDWIIVQHCDLFWREQNWLDRIFQEIDPAVTAICVPCPSRYRIGSSQIPIVGDFFGVYNRRRLIEQNLYFRWGTLGADVQVSEEVGEAIRSGLIRRDDNRPIRFGREWMDGSQAMGWELAVLGSEVKQVPLDFLHLTGFFRIAETIQRHNTTLRCDFQLDFDSYVLYSYLTSFCIERAEVEPVALPWHWTSHLTRLHGRDISEAQAAGKWLRGYSRAKEVVGMDAMGLERIYLNGTKYATRPRPVKLL